MRTNKKIIAVVAIIALVAVLGVCLVACNADSYTKKLEKAGYTVSSYKAEKDEEGKIEWGVTGAKSLTDTVTVIKYKKTDDAKAAESDLNKTLEAAGILGDLAGVEKVYRSGKIVIFGSEAGVKAAK